MVLTLHSLPPASARLRSEGLDIEERITRRGAQLHVGLLNLMPDKATTERHWLRLLARTGINTHVSLLRLHNWMPRSTSASYMAQFYQNWQATEGLDAVIITGAPLGQFDFKQVGYWQEFSQVLQYFERRQTPLLLSCWAAHAALHRFHQLSTTRRRQKLSGIFTHTAARDPLTAGLPASFGLPHSRFAQLNGSEVVTHPALQVVVNSESAGPTLIREHQAPRCYLLGHPEYEANTLALEYERDQQKGMAVAMPQHYFIEDNPSKLPAPAWQHCGAQLLSNWLRPLQGPVRHPQ
jgi:homoserine O-succinyltransferase